MCLISESQHSFMCGEKVANYHDTAWMPSMSPQATSISEGLVTEI